MVQTAQIASSYVGRWLLASTSVGLLLAASRHSPWAALAGLLCLTPFWIACARARLIEAALLGAAVGLAYGMGCGAWIPGALRGLGSTEGEALSGLVVIAAWVESPKFAVWGALAQGLRERSPEQRILALALAVGAVEWLVSTAWWGVPWGLLAYSQLDVPGVAQFAVVGGTPLVSALLAAFSVAIAGALTRDRRAARAVAGLGAAWLSLLALGSAVSEAFRSAPSGADGAAFVFLQPDLPRGDRWGRDLQPLNLHRVRLHTERLLEAISRDADALVLPENFLTAPLDRAPELAAELQEWVDEMGVPLVTGVVFSARGADRSPYRSSVVWIEPGAGISERLDKERAIPLLESERRFLGEPLLRSWLGDAASWPRVQEAEVPQGPLRGPFTVSPVLCYEILFPAISARRRSNESLAILNLADDSWAPSDAVSRHLTRIARFRAIEQRITVVRLAHGGLSAAIDPLGRVVQELAMDDYAAMRLVLRPERPPSVIEKLAIAGLPLGAFAVVWWAWGAWAPTALGGRP